jgi:hypothetical protein
LIFVSNLFFFHEENGWKRNIWVTSSSWMPNRERDCPWGEGDLVVFFPREKGTKLPFPKEKGVGISPRRSWY